MTEGYVYQPYPRMLYHWKFGQTTVKSEQEEKQHLERGWVNTPDEVWKPKRMYHPTLKPDGHKIGRRRVGKECRSGETTDRQKKKKKKEERGEGRDDDNKRKGSKSW